MMSWRSEIEERVSWRTGLVAAALTLAGAWAVRRRRRWKKMLAGQVALVTGGSRGLGFALARELVGQGCRVVICARDSDELERARQAIESEGGPGEIHARPCDVANPAEVDWLISEIVDRYGRLDLLFNNAGIIQVAPVEALEIADFHDAMNVNFWGTVYATFAALPQMRRQGAGRIVNVTSIGGKVAIPHLLPYDCAKFAAVGFSEGLRTELAADGIAVTTVVPGLMRTGSHRFAEIRGDEEKEYAWYSLLARMPGLTMDTDRAARIIVRAAKRRTPELMLGFPAKVLGLTKSLFPRPTLRALSVADRLLPSAPVGP